MFWIDGEAGKNALAIKSLKDFIETKIARKETSLAIFCFVEICCLSSLYFYSSPSILVESPAFQSFLSHSRQKYLQEVG